MFSGRPEIPYNPRVHVFMGGIKYTVYKNRSGRPGLSL